MQQANNNGDGGFSLSAIAIRQHIGTLMLTVAVIVIGVFFLTTIQVDLLPSITYPRVSVRLEAPGISPEVAVDEITRPLEETLSTTENRPLAKVLNTPPPTPPRLQGGERLLYSNAGWGSFFLIYARGLLLIELSH